MNTGAVLRHTKNDAENAAAGVKNQRNALRYCSEASPSGNPASLEGSVGFASPNRFGFALKRKVYYAKTSLYHRPPGVKLGSAR